MTVGVGLVPNLPDGPPCSERIPPLTPVAVVEFLLSPIVTVFDVVTPD